MRTSRMLSGVLALMLLAGVSSPVAAQDAKSVAGKAALRAGSPTIEQFLKIRTPGSASIAADGSMYVRDWPDGICSRRAI